MAPSAISSNGNPLPTDGTLNGNINESLDDHAKGESNGNSNNHFHEGVDPSTGVRVNGNSNIHSNGFIDPSTGVKVNGFSTNSHELAPIAIVGMACRLPGNVSSPEEFWELCSRARSGWSEMPKKRFNQDAFYHPNPDKHGCFNPRGGHFLEEDVGLFDAPFFNVTEKEAISMDPQQRLLLECTYEALEKGGIPMKSLTGKDVGVYVGGSFSDYELNNVRDTETAPMYQATGCASAVLAGRLSYFFDFSGPACTIDTACSSSLSALHLACQSLRTGETSHAVVASCHLNILPDYFVTMSMSSLFSDEGKSFAFDSRGSGFGRGEGVGCVILKPLAEALKANDPIRAVIVGSGMNQDGKTKGITMPSGEAQTALIKSVYQKAGLDPKDTGYVEAHGTGTKVGDPIEAAALHDCFGEGRTIKQPLYIGSVKSNIGHLEGASGVVSVIKSAMMLEKGFILPNYNFETPNPKIPLANWNMKVPTSQRPWPRGKKYISVNNFGFGGTNAHVVLEKAPFVKHSTGTSVPSAKQTKRLFVLSANDKSSLESQMQSLTVYLEQRPEVFQNAMLSNLAYTLGQRRSHLAWKVAVPAWSSAELIPALSSSITTSARSVKEPKIGFVYTGQGAQWHAMGRELMDTYPIYVAAIGKMDSILKELGADFSLLEELSKDTEFSRVGEAHISQPCCTAVQVALTDLIASQGIKPVAVVGHSSGEIGAAYAAGIVTLEDAMAIAYYRGQAIITLKSKYPDLKGLMLAVGGGPVEVSKLCKLAKGGKAVVACINSPSSVTVSGDEAAVSEVAKLAEEQMMFNRKLRVDVGYHSDHMKLIAEEYAADIKDIRPSNESSIVFHSSLKGRIVASSELQPAYWVDNLTNPVRFAEALKTMCEVPQGNTPNIDVLIEVGPHAALEGPIKQILKKVGGNAVKISYASTLVRNKNAVDTTMQLAATMFLKGTNLNFEAINFPVPPAMSPVVLIDLPTYPWNHSTKYWHESRISDAHCHCPFARNDIVGTLASYSNDLEPTWRNIIRVDDMPWLRDHRMQSLAVYPMSGFIAMSIEAASQRANLRGVKFDKFELREITVSRPLMIQEGPIETNITLRAHAEGTRSSSDLWDEFRIFSWASDRGWIEHCRGLISVTLAGNGNVVDDQRIRESAKAGLKERIASIKTACTARVNAGEMYETLLTAGVGYGPTFQGLEDCEACDDHAVADLIVPDTASDMPMHYEPACIIHPAFLDQFVQIVWPIFGAGRKSLDLLYMPSFVKSMSISNKISSKAGDRLRVYGSGTPTPSNPSPTKLNLFATYIGGDEAVITMDNLVMTPVRDGDGAGKLTAPRDLCYKMQWEHAPVDPGYPTLACGDSGMASNDLPEAQIGDVKISIICNLSAQRTLIEKLKESLAIFTTSVPQVGALGEIDTSGTICIVLLELDKPFIADLDSGSFETLQKMLKTTDGVVWAVCGAYTGSSSPDSNMVIGMARSIRSETLLKFATIDLSPGLSDQDSSVMVLNVLKSTFASTEPANSPDFEYQERDGKLLMPRIVDDPDMNQFVHQQIQNSSIPDIQPFLQRGRPLKLSIETFGALDSLYFVDDLAVESPLPGHEIEIEVRATSMNFKDIMISMGQLSSKYIGVECSGVVSAVGSEVTDIAIGDRVCAMTEGAYSTYARCLGTSAHQIPETMSFEAAATIPVIYCTAYYSLFDLAHLTAGESVLIHAAAGGVGQAAIILSKMIGAEIFVTVGSVAKKEFIMSEYGLPEDHILYSRDVSFAKAIKQATDGRGVDVILNSLAKNALRESWNSLAHFGRFIEIGKQDITSNSGLEMAMFEHNALFASVDLTVVAAERPRIMKRLLVDTFKLLKKGLIKPISPITVFPMSQVESAFRTLQGGKTMGKIVIVPQLDDHVRATPPKISNNFLRSDATYILIGGTGGLGRSMCRWMIGKGARHLVLVSRSVQTSEKVNELIKVASEAGAEVVIRQCDVADKEQVDFLISKNIRGMPPVRGVIHGAMVLHDTLFEKMTFDQWENVVRGKVKGAWNIHRALKDANLDFFVALSSAAGTVGNRGQAAYAAANTFLNAFVQHRVKLGLVASSIDLTAVSDAGYLAENLDRKAQVADTLGSETVSEVEVLALLAAAINGKMRTCCNSHSITGLKIRPDTKDLFWVEDAKFSHLRLAAATAAQQESISAPVVSLNNAVKNSQSFNEALQLIFEGLITKVCAVLMFPREEIDPSRPIVAYGLDSLVAIEIRNWITRELEANLQVLELLTSTSIIALAATIVQKSKLTNFKTEGAN